MIDLSWVALRSVRAAQKVSRVLPASWYAFLRVRWHNLRNRLPPGIASRQFHGLPGRLHVTDYMHLESGISRYIAIGREAVQNIDATLVAASRTWAEVTRFLDYGCGYGRVLRWLGGRGFEVVGADVNAQAVRFCATEFGATPFLIPLGRDDWTLPGSFDLIWVGSVLTHLTQQECTTVLTRLAGALRPAGLLVFTTHGEVRGSGLEYGKDVARVTPQIGAALAAGEVMFVPNRETPAWGYTFHSRAAVEVIIAALGLRLVRFAPRAWDAHQDVWGVTR